MTLATISTGGRPSGCKPREADRADDVSIVRPRHAAIVYCVF